MLLNSCSTHYPYKNICRFTDYKQILFSLLHWKYYSALDKFKPTCRPHCRHIYCHSEIAVTSSRWLLEWIRLACTVTYRKGVIFASQTYSPDFPFRPEGPSKPLSPLSPSEKIKNDMQCKTMFTNHVTNDPGNSPSFLFLRSCFGIVM